MPRRKGAVNKSKAIRDLLAANKKMPVKEVIDTLAKQGIKVQPNLVYFVKGHMRGKKKGRKVRQEKTTAGAPSHHGDALATVIKVKKLAEEVGGLKKLRSLVEALSE
jgi:hypothetical protein